MIKRIYVLVPFFVGTADISELTIYAHIKNKFFHYYFPHYSTISIDQSLTNPHRNSQVERLAFADAHQWSCLTLLLQHNDNFNM